jgi:hypothetical protein
MADPAAPLVGYGEVQLQLMVASANGYDTLALGGLTVIVAAIAALATLKTPIGTGWWVPMLPLTVAAAGCITALATKEIDLGKPLARIVIDNEGEPAAKINAVLVAELALALKLVEDRVAAKRFRLTIALAWVIIAGVLSGALFPNV